MSTQQILAIVGSYRKEGMIDQAVDQALAAAAAQGAETHKIYLIDESIEFCRNCRSCTQAPGPERGHCVLADSGAALLDQIDRADGLILASPVNIGDVTAVTRRLLERMVCYTYWPWGQAAPKPRNQKARRNAVLITASAMPGPMARLLTNAMRSLRRMARTIGARPIGQMFIGIAAQAADQRLADKDRALAAALGRKLAANH